MDDEKKIKLSCSACDASYWAEAIDSPVDASPGSFVPYTCPVCDHEESKVEE
jgi:hypothetical protein